MSISSKTIPITFAAAMLLMVTSMGIRHILTPLQIEDKAKLSSITDACNKTKGCLGVKIIPQYDAASWNYLPRVIIKVAPKSRLSLLDLRAVFDDAMSERYKTLNRFQKWTQKNHTYGVEYGN